MEAERLRILEKRKLVRKSTLTHHGEYVRRELAWEVSGGSAVLVALAAVCALWPAACGLVHSAAHCVLFFLAQLLLHTLMSFLGYRACAWLRQGAALALGLAAAAVHYAVLVALLLWDGRGAGAGTASHMSWLLARPPAPWVRLHPPAANQPEAWQPRLSGLGALQQQQACGTTNGLSVMGLEPWSGWHGVLVLSGSLAWSYGVLQWTRVERYVKQRNGLKF